MRDPLLDDLDPHQRDAVVASSLPLAIVAPAGSGKTRVLTRRIAYRIREGHSEARHVLAVTFTRHAAAQLVDRLAHLDVDDAVTAGTFHALALAQLRRRAADRRQEPPTVLDRKARILGPLLGGSGAAAAAAMQAVATEIEWAKARLVSPDRFPAAARAAGRQLPRPAEELSALYARYEAEKRTRRLCDFDDLLSGLAEAIERDEEFAAAQRWRFRHLYVDEFQDATPLQLRLVRGWLGDRVDLCVVGDPAQSIYAFTGADPGVLAAFDRHFPGARTLALTRTYRSTPQIVGFAASVLGAATRAAGEHVHAARTAGAPPDVRAYHDDAAEATGVAQQLWQYFTHGVPWSRMAVLFRTNAQAARFETALGRRAIPTRLPDARRFADRPAVRALLDRLRGAERAAPGRSFTDHLADLDDACLPERGGGRHPGQFVSRESRATAQHGSEEADAAAEDQPREDVLAARDELKQLGREYLVADGGRGTFAGFCSWLDVATGREAGAHGVELATFHRAKGLEWQVVFVTGVERGLVPISWAASPEALDEERRLLHVALSRAEDHLHVSWAYTRTIRARRITREPSPWLPGLEEVAARSTRRPVDPRVRLAEVARTLADIRPAPPAPGSLRRRMP